MLCHHSLPSPACFHFPSPMRTVCASLLPAMPLWSRVSMEIYSRYLQESMGCSLCYPLMHQLAFCCGGPQTSVPSSLALSPYPDSHNLVWLLGMCLLQSVVNATSPGSASTRCLCTWPLLLSFQSPHHAPLLREAASNHSAYTSSSSVLFSLDLGPLTVASISLHPDFRPSVPLVCVF